jgi:hypothetical protein
MEFEMFKTIKPTEFLDQAWLSKDKEKLAPGIMNMTKWSTRVRDTLHPTKKKKTTLNLFLLFPLSL